MKGHTYIFREGAWSSNGTYWDQDYAEMPLDGINRIIHEPKAWYLKGKLELPTNPPTILDSQYEIVPPIPHVPTMIWFSINPVIGRVSGTFTVIQNTIISSFASEDYVFSGAECLILLSESSYRAEGVFYRGKRRISSWSCILEHMEDYD